MATKSSALLAEHPTPPSQDEDLVLRAAAGSRDAFEAIVRRYQKQVFYVCCNYVHDMDVAADLTQRAFLRAMSNISQVRNAMVFRSWLFKIVINLARNHLRDAAKFVDEDTPEPAVAPEALSALESAERSEALRRAVSALPNKQRLVLRMRVYDELPFREIARALGTSEGAAKVNFHYAVKALRARLPRVQNPHL